MLTSGKAPSRAVGTVWRGLFALSVLALVAATPALGSAKQSVATKVTIINVTAGKPSELAFKLSKFSNIPLGKVEFKIVDGGVAFHDFKICTTATTGATKNTCVGQTTKILHPKQTATLIVTITKAGTYEFLCTVPGHAAAGMKGIVGVGVPVTAAAEAAAHKPTASTGGTTSTSGSTTTTTSPPPTGGGTPATDKSADPACPSGTIESNNGADGDEDEGGATSDGDGCV